MKNYSWLVILCVTTTLAAAATEWQQVHPQGYEYIHGLVIFQIPPGDINVQKETTCLLRGFAVYNHKTVVVVDSLASLNPADKEIVGGYRYILIRDAEKDEKGVPKLSTSHYFKFSEKFLKDYAFF